MSVFFKVIHVLRESMSQLADSSLSTNQNSAVKYQGRKTSRAGSEQRRRLILEAALRIVIREGVRGIRHRAVAKEADVPLAATTYYFKDIQELINDTFTLYAEQALEVVNQFAMRLYEPLAGAEGKSFVEAMASATDMSEIIAENMTQYAVEQITQHRDALIAEQAFRYEAILSPHLRKLGEVHKLALMQKLTDLLELMQSPNPAADATIVISVLHRIEYEGLLVEPENLDQDAIRSTLLRQLNLMLNAN
jgi:DNA-binding transcriptional regulator YbjK